MAISKGKRITPDIMNQRSVLPRKAQSVVVNNPFRLACLPTRWTWVEETGEFLPALLPIPWTAGVNGGRVDPRTGSFDDSGPSSNIRGKGGVIIHPEDSRLGKFKGYMSEHAVEGGRTMYTTIFEGFEIMGRDAYHEVDTDEVREFQRVLLESGVVEPIHDFIKRREVAKVEERIKRTGAKDQTPRVAEQLAHEKARRIGMLYGLPVLVAAEVVKVMDSEQMSERQAVEKVTSDAEKGKSKRGRSA